MSIQVTTLGFNKPTVSNFSDNEDYVQGSSSPWVLRSPGITLCKSFMSGGTISSKWKLISVSIKSHLGLNNSTTSNAFGKLGKIVGGFTLKDGEIAETQYSPINPSLQDYPSDMSLISTMWDPTNDNLPPSVTTAIALNPTLALPIFTTITPNNPLELYPDQKIYAAIWVLPSLLGSSTAGDIIALRLLNSIATLVYDDGL